MSLPQLDYDPRCSWNSNNSNPLEWVSELTCWCVFDAKTISTILKSADFVAADFAELHRTYERRVGIDCAALIQVLYHVATANEGKRHAEVRRESARVLTANSAQTKQITLATLKALVATLCGPDKRVDLVREIVRPVCDAMFESVLGVAAAGQVKEGASASQVFDLYLGLNRRREINAKACAMIDRFARQTPKLRTSPEYSTALSMLGYDSIVASLGCSLLHILKDAQGRHLSDMSFPRELPATGVPYVERFASKDAIICGTAISKGDRIRLYLDSGETDQHARSRPYFGRGRH